MHRGLGWSHSQHTHSKPSSHERQMGRDEDFPIWRGYGVLRMDREGHDGNPNNTT